MQVLSRIWLISTLAALVAVGTPALAQDAQTWRSLKPAVFGERTIQGDSPLVTINAPARAEDAAMVPIEIAVKLPEGDSRTVRSITLIIDENPSPVAATFRFGKARRDVELSTRVRVNDYSHVRAIAETSDGALHMNARFVKASGGCSAPALKDPDEAMAHIGKMRIRPLPVREPAAMSRVQLMIRHPNNSGLQMDQLTRLYIPAMFVDHITVKQGNDLVFEMEGGISISEDPTFRFNYPDNGGSLAVEAHDTDGRRFTGMLPAAADGRS